ncbi:hypothetical protein SGFS_104100 [Streptomyces graminofaciens]|uniref:Insertion element IS402-like domain-containing protein n=1 Tax=Streptomyces graminofaciens TaxID=68212 RepID=A0ABN5W090_9ACTN|nr:transposase [Streptomyces graminofaciens]BBC39116.1 hypothetical protein SGFS_104100 [Streptomyces graminofaciens]
MADGIRFRVRTGIPWRDMPADYGSWARVYDLLGSGVRPVPSLTTGRHLASDLHCLAGTGRHERSDHPLAESPSAVLRALGLEKDRVREQPGPVPAGDDPAAG